MGVFHYFLSNKRLFLLLFASSLLFLSVLGSPDTKIYHLVISLDINSLNNLFYSSDTFFRTPNTSLRFILFTIAIIIIIFIPMVSLSNEGYYHKYIHLITKYLVVLFLLTILSTQNLYNYAALILLLLSLYYLLFYSSKELSRIEIYFLTSYILLFYYPFLHSFFIETNLSEMDNYVRFLFALPLYLLIREINIKEVYFKLIINHASLVIGVSAIYFHIYHDSVRINGYTSTATIFGNISLLFACLSLLSIKPLKDSLFKYYPIISAILAFHAWSLTGTRSSLLIIPIFIIIFLFSKDLRENFLPKVNLKLVSIFLIVIAIIISQSNVYKRSIDSYETSYSYFFENGEFNWKHKNSLVPRLLIWKGTMNIIKENPLMGVGQDNFNQYLNSQIKDKKIDPIRNNQQNPTAGLNHAHNQYLDIFAKTGITGLFLLLFFLIMNLFFFLKRYLHNKNCFYAKSGLLTIITYSTYMLNHTIISHQQSSLFLSFFLIIMAGLSNHMKNAKL